MLARRIVFAVSLLLNFVLFFTLVWGEERGAVGYKRLRERCASLEERIKQVGDDNLKLSREIRLLQSDDRYLEKIIRNRLNFVRENEILYTFPGDAKAEPRGAPPHETKD